MSRERQLDRQLIGAAATLPAVSEASLAWSRPACAASSSGDAVVHEPSAAAAAINKGRVLMSDLLGADRRLANWARRRLNGSCLWPPAGARIPPRSMLERRHWFRVPRRPSSAA